MKLMELIEGDVIQGPWPEKKKTSKAIKIPIRHVFGGREYNIIHDAGYRFTEKPHSFNDINAIPKDEIVYIENLLGRKLRVYNSWEVLHFRSEKEGPIMVDYEHNIPKEETFILFFEKDYVNDINRDSWFLCNKTGATKYIRMWAKIL